MRRSSTLPWPSRQALGKAATHGALARTHQTDKHQGTPIVLPRLTRALEHEALSRLPNHETAVSFVVFSCDAALVTAIESLSPRRYTADTVRQAL